MTVYELQHRFNVEVEKFGIVHPVLSTIIEDHINWEYQKYVTEKYDSLINPAEKFEITERISRILAPLIADYNVTSFTPITTNNVTGKFVGYYAAGPGETVLQYIIKESAVLNTTDCNGNALAAPVKIIPIKHNMIAVNLNNPFLQPDDEEAIWRMNIMSGRLELLIPYGTTLASYTARYLKKITPIDFISGTTIEIDSSVHEEIALKAAYTYLSNLSNESKQKQS